MSHIDCGVLLCVLSRNPKNEAVLAGIGLLRLREREREIKQKKSMKTPITCHQLNVVFS